MSELKFAQVTRRVQVVFVTAVREGTFKPKLRAIDFDRLTKRNYLFLRQLGYTKKEIIKSCTVKKGEFEVWLIYQGITFHDQRIKTINRMVFSGQDVLIPYWEGE